MFQIVKTSLRKNYLRIFYLRIYSTLLWVLVQISIVIIWLKFAYSCIRLYKQAN